MDIYLQNTLSGKKEKFTPIKEGEVSMYNCGPTVYDYAHIGNFRTFILNDLLRRIFEYNGYSINQVMNITDVDDKTIKRSQEEKISLKNLTRKYEEIFLNDSKSLNILSPTKTPRATDNISEIISIIEKLLERGVAYKSSDGIYFDISKSKNYGKLVNLNLENSAKERVANDEYDKENARDFALWKFYTTEDGGVVYDAPFGKGRPGWHIECSAMSMKELGETIDIHTGGQDLIFPHHTNEIAQSEGVTGKIFVNYWVHGGFITIEGKKMSKSLGNIITLETLKEKNIDPLAFRYFVLGTHYSTLLNFTWQALDGVQTAWKKLRSFMSRGTLDTKLTVSKTVFDSYRNRFNQYINDDLDMPKALALVWEIVKDDKLPEKNKRDLILDFDRVLGLKLDKIEEIEEIKTEFTIIEDVTLPIEIKTLIRERDKARKNGDFETSDEIRGKMESMGVIVKDEASISRYFRKKA